MTEVSDPMAGLKVPVGFAVVALARESGAASSVYGPLTYRAAERLNEAIRVYGPEIHLRPGGIQQLRAFDETTRFFIAGRCIYDPRDWSLEPSAQPTPPAPTSSEAPR